MSEKMRYYCLRCKEIYLKEDLVYGENANVIMCPKCHHNEFKLLYEKDIKNKKDLNLDEILVEFMEEKGLGVKIIEDIINERGVISEENLIEELRRRTLIIALNECAELGLIKMEMDDEGQTMISRGDKDKI